MQTSIGVAGALLVGFVASGAPALASDPRNEKAREHYLQGDAYYKLDIVPGRFRASVARSG